MKFGQGPIYVYSIFSILYVFFKGDMPRIYWRICWPILMAFAMTFSVRRVLRIGADKKIFSPI